MWKRKPEGYKRTAGSRLPRNSAGVVLKSPAWGRPE